MRGSEQAATGAEHHPGQIAIEPAAFKDVFRKVPTAVAIVTAMTPDGTPVGLTVGSFASVSLDPPIVSLSVWASLP